MDSKNNRSTLARRGFTLVELLVVISIIALLLGILLPALGKARSAAWRSVSAANLRQFSIAMQAYANDYKRGILGAPTISARSLLQNPEAESASGPIDLKGGTATQPWDWAGPMISYISDSFGIPRQSDELFAQLNGVGDATLGIRTDGSGLGATGGNLTGGGATKVFYDPSNRTISLPFGDGGVMPQGVPGTLYKAQTRFSYSTARDFLWWSTEGQSRSLPAWANEAQPWWATRGKAIRPKWANWSPPGGIGGSGYKPFVDNVGRSLSQKIYMFEGARFLLTDLLAPDHDFRPGAGFGGSFSDLGGYDLNNTRTLPNGSLRNGQDAASLSFRHGSKTEPQGNVVFYDGHTELISLREARRPEFWLPSGTSLQFSTIANEVKDEYENLEQTGRFAEFGQGFIEIW